MSALRLARGATGRDRILKFCYHGHADALAAAGSGLATLGIPSSPGVPAGAAADTLVCPFNDVEAVTAAVERHGAELAAIIVEPVAGNMGVVPPAPGFLEALRARAPTRRAPCSSSTRSPASGSRGGAQELYGVEPDLTVLGKIAGGGLPLAAFGGRAEIMDEFASMGPVYQAGTLSGNPLATAAALATLQRLRDPSVYAGLEEAGRGSEAACGPRPGTRRSACSAWARWRPLLPRGAGDELRGCGRERHRALRRLVPALARAGVYAPSQFEASSSRPPTARPRSTRRWRRRVTSSPADVGIWATIADEAVAKAPLGGGAPARGGARRDTGVLAARRGPLRLASSPSTRAISSTTADRGSSHLPMPTPRSCWATTSTPTGLCVCSPTARWPWSAISPSSSLSARSCGPRSERSTAPPGRAPSRSWAPETGGSSPCAPGSASAPTRRRSSRWPFLEAGPDAVGRALALHAERGLRSAGMGAALTARLRRREVHGGGGSRRRSSRCSSSGSSSAASSHSASSAAG